MNVDSSLQLLRLASRNLVRHRGRTAMTVSAIAFGVAALISSGGFIEDVLSQLRVATIKSRLGHLEVSRNGYAEQGRRDPFRFLIDDAPAIADELEREPGIDDVAVRISFQGLLNNGRSDLAIIAEGLERGLEGGFDGYVRLIAGRPVATGDISSGLVGEGVAKAMQLKPGDFVTLVANVPGGATNTMELRVAGVFRTFSSDFDNRAVRVPLAAAQELLTVRGGHSLVISLASTDATKSIADTLEARLGPRGLAVHTWYELDDFYAKTRDLYERQFRVLQLIILAVVMLSVANSVNMTAFERIAEFGTLRAMGARTGGIAAIILVENLLLGVAGAAIGVLVAAVISVIVSSIGIPMPPPPNANSGYDAKVIFVPSIVAVAALIGIVATLASSMFAVYRVSRTSIIDALRQSV